MSGVSVKAKGRLRKEPECARLYSRAESKKSTTESETHGSEAPA